MSKRSDLKQHLTTLGEIKSIMGAMKNLSLIEIGKITRASAMQSKVVAKIEETASDFMSFFPHRPPASEHEEREGYLLIGSERGFCGGFNEALIDKLSLARAGGDPTREPLIVLVGRKLMSKFGSNAEITAAIDGPSATEEIHSVIRELVNQLEEIQKTRGPFHLCCWSFLYNRETPGGIETVLLKPFSRLSHSGTRHFANAPTLNIDPEEFLEETLDHYLFAAMYQIFYDSFMAENKQRLRHMEGALQRLDREWTRLTLKGNSLRQEEITEEIEIIMLSAEALIGDFQ